MNHNMESLINNQGLNMKIIKYNNTNDIDILFDDGTIVKNKKYCHFKSGQIRNPNYYIDHSGEIYGDLTTIRLHKRVQKYSKRNTKDGFIDYYECECVCGNKTIVKLSNLQSGNTRGCGCKTQEKMILGLKNKVTPNEYIINKDFVIGIAKNTKSEFLIDYDDYVKIKDMAWYENKDGYLINRVDGEVTLLHRFIMNCESDKNKIVDHINRKPLDNRKKNLRFATMRENAMNHSKSKDSKNKNIGVYFRADKGNVWYSHIRVNNKLLFLGSYKKEEDAIVARLKAEKLYFGEFAPQRHLFEQYNI